MAKDSKETKEKPLDKMTVKELRDIAKEIPDITGVHGMNKADLLSAIKAARGIKEEPKKKVSATVKQMKAQIKLLKAQRAEALAAKDRKRSAICRRQISRLKKKTRRAA